MINSELKVILGHHNINLPFHQRLSKSCDMRFVVVIVVLLCLLPDMVFIQSRLTYGVEDASLYQVLGLQACISLHAQFYMMMKINLRNSCILGKLSASPGFGVGSPSVYICFAFIG